MTFKEWINRVISSGNLCDEYTDKVNEARSKKALIDVCLDSNGSGWLCEMDSKGITLPYETILKEFGAYINARYVAEYEGKNGGHYNSCIYCRYDEDECLVETTCVTMLGCKTNVLLKENSYVFIYADKNCDLTIHVPNSAHCKVEYWCDAKITIVGCEKNVKLKHR